MEYKDITDYKNPTAFPEHASVYTDKIEEEMTDAQKVNQKALNTSLRLEKRKVTKVYWSEIVDFMLTKTFAKLFFVQIVDHFGKGSKYSANPR